MLKLRAYVLLLFPFLRPKNHFLRIFNLKFRGPLKMTLVKRSQFQDRGRSWEVESIVEADGARPTSPSGLTTQRHQSELHLDQRHQVPPWEPCLAEARAPTSSAGNQRLLRIINQCLEATCWTPALSAPRFPSQCNRGWGWKGAGWGGKGAEWGGRGRDGGDRRVSHSRPLLLSSWDHLPSKLPTLQSSLHGPLIPGERNSGRASLQPVDISL